LYVATTSPTLTYGGDCGELIAASYVLGNAHPTGYPLYLLLGKLFSLLPVGEVAFRYNLFSAVCSAGAAAVVAVTVFRLCRDALAALVAAWSFACAYVVWTQAIIAEVYALSALLISLTIFTAVTFVQTKDARWLGATAFAFGLGLTNHLPILFIGVTLGGYCVWRYGRVDVWTNKRPHVHTSTRPYIFALFFLLPLALYLYLPLRAHANPPMNWGNPATFSAFWAHVSGKLYQSHVFAVPLVVLPQRLLALGGLMALQFLLAFPIGLMGGWQLGKQGWGLALILGALLDVAVYVNYDVLDPWNFFFPVYVTFGLCVGLGAAALRAWVRKFFVTAQRLAVLLTTVSMLCLPALQVWAAYPQVTMRGNRRAYQDARALLQATSPNSTLFIKGDESLFGVWYLQNVEGRGNDRKIVYGKELIDGLQRGTLSPRVQSALRQGRVFLNFWDDHLARRFYLRPCDAACEVLERERQTPPRRVERATGKPLVDLSDAALWNVRLSQTSIKRGNLLALNVRWQAHRPVRAAKVEILFVHPSVAQSELAKDHELSHALAVNKQYLSWRAERSLTGKSPGVWEESFPVEIRDDSMIGRFRCLARLKVNGRTSHWHRVGTLTIVDK
jgi:hypothetical protein